MTIALVILAAFAGSPAPAQRPPTDVRLDEGLPTALRAIGIDQRLDETIPRDIELVDETGRSVRLGEFFGERPVILVPAYYTCPMLCSQVLQGVTRSLSVVNLEIGKDFEIVTFSFGPAGHGGDGGRN